MRPTVTVLLPVRDAGAWLRPAVESIAANNTKTELIVVDDGSADSALDDLQRSGLLKNATLLRPGRVGLANALQLGLAKATAPWLARMDADDISSPGRLDTTLQILLTLPAPRNSVISTQVTPFCAAPAVAPGMRRFCDWLNALLTPEDHWRGRLVDQPLANPTSIVATEAVRRAGGYRDGAFPEDYDLWLRLFEAGFKFHKVPKKLLKWRDSPTRFTRADFRCSRDNIRRLKADHLLRTWPELRAQGQIQVIGAGHDAKRWCDLLLERGVEVVRAFDLGKRVGGMLRGRISVLHHSQLSQHLSIPTIVAIARAGGRDEVRAELQRKGLVETAHFYCVT